MIALACAALAVALVCAPGPGARRRVLALWPAPRGRRLRRLPAPAVATGLVGALAGVLVAGPAGALVGAVVAVLVRRRRAARSAAADADATAGELAAALRRMTDELRAGAHPTSALEGTVGDGPRARAVLAEAAVAARLGDGVPAALMRGAEQRPNAAADLRRVARAWRLAERHGIPLAETLSTAAADMTWRLQYARRVRAQLAGPRATAAVLTALPVLGIALGELLGAEPVAVLRGGVLGQVLLVLGMGLTAAGHAWSEHILRRAVPR
jgi:tight adherence protein B